MWEPHATAAQAPMRRSHDVAGRVWRPLLSPSPPREVPAYQTARISTNLLYVFQGWHPFPEQAPSRTSSKACLLGRMPIDPSVESPHLCPLGIGSDTLVVPQGIPFRSDPRSCTDEQAFTVYSPKFRGFLHKLHTNVEKSWDKRLN